MKQVVIHDPNGLRWIVRRRWLPWSVRWRGPGRARKRREKEEKYPGWTHVFDVADPLLWFDEAPGGFLLILGLVVAAVVTLFVLPFFVFLIEVLLVALVAGIGIVFRIVFRRPWLVEAYPVEGPHDKHLIWKVAGVRRSGLAVDDIAEQIRSGIPTPVVPGAILVRG
jgi:hypothetical protein